LARPAWAGLGVAILIAVGYLAYRHVASAALSSSAVFVGLWITGTELNITAMMGMVMIVGIATEMAIFLASEYTALGTTNRRARPCGAPRSIGCVPSS